ncbi:MAG: putative sugar O-methyltransferase [Candidatus Omnitrophota bacterium]
MPLLNDMFEVFLSSNRKELFPSKYWVTLNKKNLEQLEKYGYDNFKRTIALNYFTWLVSPWDEQIKYLAGNLPVQSVIKNAVRTLLTGKHKCFNWAQSLSYNFITYMVYEYVLRRDKARLLDSLNEPLEGNPPEVYLKQKLISQDLANSVLEFKAIMDSGIERKSIKTIIELGAGYGRTAYVFLKLIPGVRYFIVDIPPALYIAQEYLSHQFKNRKIFGFRKFKQYSEIKGELEDSDIAFFLPTQLEALPDKAADLFINISSLHEMKKEQISYYFNEINRLTQKYFYFKEWKVSRIPGDNITISEQDYPVAKGWELIYWKECLIQTKFFEALFKLER